MNGNRKLWKWCKDFVVILSIVGGLGGIFYAGQGIGVVKTEMANVSEKLDLLTTNIDKFKEENKKETAFLDRATPNIIRLVKLQGRPTYME